MKFFKQIAIIGVLTAALISATAYARDIELHLGNHTNHQLILSPVIQEPCVKGLEIMYPGSNKYHDFTGPYGIDPGQDEKISTNVTNGGEDFYYNGSYSIKVKDQTTGNEQIITLAWMRTYEGGSPNLFSYMYHQLGLSPVESATKYTSMSNIMYVVEGGYTHGVALGPNSKEAANKITTAISTDSVFCAVNPVLIGRVIFYDKDTSANAGLTI